MMIALRDDESGVSLPEVMVSIVVLAIAMTGLASTLTTAIANVSDDEQLTRANQAATQVLEGLRTIDWDDVGFYADDPSYSATAGDGAATVVLGTNRPAGSPAPLPTSQVNIDGVDFDIALEVVWQDDPNQPPGGAADPDPNDYKQLRLTLSWVVRGVPFETTYTGDRFPTVSEVPVEDVPDCSPGSIVSMDISPPFVFLSSPGGTTTEPVRVTVETCTEVSSVQLDPDPRPAIGMSQDPADPLVWSYDLNVGSSIDPGEYVWVASSTSVDGNDTAEDLVQFAEEGNDLLEIVGTQLSEQPFCVNNSRRTYNAIAVTTTITGIDASDDVVIGWTADAGQQTAAYLGTDANGDLVFSTTIPANHRFREDTTTVSVSATRAEDGQNVSDTYVVDTFRTSNQASCP